MKSEFDLVWLLKSTLRTPRQAAEHLLSLSLPRQALWLLFWLVVVLSMIFQIVVAELIQFPAESGISTQSINPVFAAIDSALLNAAMIFGLYKGGEAWSGRGSLEQSAVIYSYLQIFGLSMLLTMFLVIAALPFLIWFAPLVMAIWVFWINLCFVDRLHGFESLGKAFGLIVAVWVGVFLLQVLFAGLTGGLVGG